MAAEDGKHSDGEGGPDLLQGMFKRLAERSLQGLVIAQLAPPRIVFANKAIGEITGLAVDELSQLDFLQVSELIHPQDRAAFVERARQRERGEELSDRFDIRLVRPDGEVRWLEVLVQPFELDGQPAIQAVFQDVTDRQEAKNAMNLSEERYRSLFEKMNDAALLADTETGMVVDANRRAEELWARSRAELIGMHQAGLHPPEEVERYRRKFEHHVQKGSTEDLDAEILRPDGSRIPVVISSAIVTIGEEHFNLGIFRDITEQLQSQEALRRSESLLRLTIDNIPDLVSVHDLDRKVMLSNWRGYEHLPEEVRKGHPHCYEAYRERTEQCEDCHLDELIAEPKPMRFVKLNPADGRTREFSIIPVLDQNDELIAAVEVLRDVTDQKEKEEERLRFQERMLQAQKLESLGVLAGGIAHDFNNLLMGVLGNADLALMDLPPESATQRNLDQIRQATLQAADLAQQLLAYSGKGRFVTGAVDLNMVFEDMTQLLKATVAGRAVMEVDLAAKLPAVQADVVQVRQVVMNLITNAAEAIQGDGGTIGLRTSLIECDRACVEDTFLPAELEEGPYVCLEVTDNGAGMAPEMKDRIFDPFFTTKFTGRGLGLAAVLGIVRRHHGALSVSSVPGEGTSFRVLLPIGNPEATAEQQVEEREFGFRAQGKVLVVDDEHTPRRVACKMITRIGFGVLSAKNGEEALELYREHGEMVALVLLDLTMPQMDGQVVLERLRALDPDVKVILSSGYNEHEVVGRLTGQHPNGFLQKPYLVSTLLDMIRRTLDS